MFAKLLCLLSFIVFGVGFAMGMTQQPKDFTVAVLLLSLGMAVIGSFMWPEIPVMARCKAKRTEEMRAHIDS